METTSLLIGILAGTGLGYLLFYLLYKSKTVARSTYDVLAEKHQESVTHLRVAEDRLKSQEERTMSFQQKSERNEQDLAALLNKTASQEAHLSATAERLKELTEQLAHQTQTNKLQQQEINDGQQQLAELRAQHAALLEKLNTHKQEILDIQKTAHLQFEKIAQQIFEEKSGKFTETNKVNIEALLKPLNENIDTFKKKVEETYDKESKQRFSLEEKVKDLIENTQKISQEANNLAAALKGQAKKQGDWGETILERILELSGLEKNREYFVQGNLKDEFGNNQRPDIIVRLPDDRNIIIDSKVSLNAYLRYSDADSKEQQDIFIAQHLQALNQHIDQLSLKKYDQLEISSLDFVIMFIPIEPAYILAVQSDPDLWAYAYTRRILLISPTNLIAVLKIVADLWKRELQNKNALAIANEGTRLYDKFVSFIVHMEEVGKHLNKSQDAYLHALGQLKDGRGNLISRVLKLKKLGLKSSRALPSTMLTADQDEDDETGTLTDADEADDLPRPVE